MSEDNNLYFQGDYAQVDDPYHRGAVTSPTGPRVSLLFLMQILIFLIVALTVNEWYHVQHSKGGVSVTMEVGLWKVVMNRVSAGQTQSSSASLCDTDAESSFCDEAHTIQAFTLMALLCALIVSATVVPFACGQLFKSHPNRVLRRCNVILMAICALCLVVSLSVASALRFDLSSSLPFDTSSDVDSTAEFDICYWFSMVSFVLSVIVTIILALYDRSSNDL